MRFFISYTIHMTTPYLTMDAFAQEVEQAAHPVLVKFGAAWCQPCKMLDPIIDEIAQEAQGVKVWAVDIDDQPELAQRFTVMSVPTMLFFKDGKVMDQMVGVQSKGMIVGKLEELKA